MSIKQCIFPRFAIALLVGALRPVLHVAALRPEQEGEVHAAPDASWSSDAGYNAASTLETGQAGSDSSRFETSLGVHLSADHREKISQVVRAVPAAATASGMALLETGTLHAVKHAVSNAFFEKSSAEDPQTKEKPKEITFAKAFITAAISTLSGLAISCVVSIFYVDPKKLPVGEAGENVHLVEKQYEYFSTECWECHKDAEICLCSCCCPHVRWAMTMSLVPQLFTFWMAFALICAFDQPRRIICLTGAEFAKNDRDIYQWELSQNVSSTEHGFRFGLPDEHKWLDAIGSVLWLISVLIPMFYRQEIRRRFNMPSGGPTLIVDFCMYCCCSCCAIAQEARHIHGAIKDGHSVFVGEPVRIDTGGG